MTDEAVLPPGVIRIDTSGRRQYSVEFKRRLAKVDAARESLVIGASLA